MWRGHCVCHMVAPTLFQTAPQSSPCSVSKRSAGPHPIAMATLIWETSFRPNLVMIPLLRCLWTPPKVLFLPPNLCPLLSCRAEGRALSLGTCFPMWKMRTAWKAGPLPDPGAGQPWVLVQHPNTTTSHSGHSWWQLFGT